jgi:predicted nucleic acid-binding protein
MVNKYSLKNKYSVTEINNNAFVSRITNPLPNKEKIKNILENIDTTNILNIKELMYFSLLNSPDEIPDDIFNIICNNIIKSMTNIKSLDYMDFRDQLYDILVYNLDITDCLWYILSHFIQLGAFSMQKPLVCAPSTSTKIHPFFDKFKGIQQVPVSSPLNDLNNTCTSTNPPINETSSMYQGNGVVGVIGHNGQKGGREKMEEMLNRIYTFLKYYNNNYRPIYHLESIFYYFIIEIHGFNDAIYSNRKTKGKGRENVQNTRNK